MWLAHLMRAYQARKKEKKLLNKPARSQERFLKKYPQFKIGKHTYGVPHVKNLHKDATLTIGDYCSIAENVSIYLSGIHRTDWISTYPFPAFYPEANHIKAFEITDGNVTIGNDVWLCANSVILSGVTIGDGAVIGNSAVVTKDVPPYAIVAGVPAKVIRKRFDDETIQWLLDVKWWSWSEQEIKQVIPMLCSQDLDAFKDYYDKKTSKNI